MYTYKQLPTILSPGFTHTQDAYTQQPAFCDMQYRVVPSIVLLSDAKGINDHQKQAECDWHTPLIPGAESGESLSSKASLPEQPKIQSET